MMHLSVLSVAFPWHDSIHGDLLCIPKEGSHYKVRVSAVYIYQPTIYRLNIGLPASNKRRGWRHVE